MSDHVSITYHVTVGKGQTPLPGRPVPEKVSGNPSAAGHPSSERLFEKPHPR